MNSRFYTCSKCGMVLGLINGDADCIKCCGKTIEPLVANETYNEKHSPNYEVKGDKIVVTINHGMSDEHHIAWIALMNENQTIRIALNHNQEPKVEFPYIKNSKIFAYCNLHGLWVTDVK